MNEDCGLDKISVRVLLLQIGEHENKVTNLNISAFILTRISFFLFTTARHR
jgi:hypothetical protein